MVKLKFLRRDSTRHPKLGKGRKKKQTWRRPTGRDNKMREKRRGYPAVVSIGYKKEERKEILVVNNLKDLEKAKKNQIIVIGKVGKKKRLEIEEEVKNKKIKIHNLKKKQKEKKKTEKKEVSKTKKTVEKK